MAPPYSKPLLDLSGNINKDGALPFVTDGQIFVSYDMKVPGRNNHTGIIIPSGHSAGATIDMILYFHGDGAPPIKDYFRNRKFKDIIDASRANVILVAPQLGASSEFGNFANASDIIAYLKAMLGFLVDYGPYNSAPVIGNLILAAHSGGGRGMQSTAAQLAGNPDFTIPEAWAFDCLYGAGNPLAAPEPLRVAEAGHKSAGSLEDWERLNNAAEEFRWAFWTRAVSGRVFKAFWGAGGTKTRTANLDLWSLLKAAQRTIQVDPHFFKSERKPLFQREDTKGDRIDVNPRSPGIAWETVFSKIVPTPPPVAPHDLVPQTVLGECIAQSGNIR